MEATNEIKGYLQHRVGDAVTRIACSWPTQPRAHDSGQASTLLPVRVSQLDKTHSRTPGHPKKALLHNIGLGHREHSMARESKPIFGCRSHLFDVRGKCPSLYECAHPFSRTQRSNRRQNHNPAERASACRRTRQHARLHPKRPYKPSLQPH